MLSSIPVFHARQIIDSFPILVSPGKEESTITSIQDAQTDANWILKRTEKGTTCCLPKVEVVELQHLP